MNRKNILIAVIILVLLVAGNYWYARLNEKVASPMQDSGEGKLN